MCLLVSDKVVRQGDIGFFKTMRLPRMVLKNGGRFGRDGGRFDSQASSLGYLLTPFQGSMRACRMVAGTASTRELPEAGRRKACLFTVQVCRRVARNSDFSVAQLPRNDGAPWGLEWHLEGVFPLTLEGPGE